MNTFARILPLAALLPALATEPASAQQSTISLSGRVFFTNAERRALETKAVSPAASPPAPPAVTANPRRFDGALWRGKQIVTLWFDGKADDPTSDAAIRIIDGSPAMTLDGRSRALFPGGTWPPQDAAGETP
ncbi:MAG: hypothetical protein LBF61_05605 [Azoarcus sp.]|jgi:hypothetical protein|nr:hypothetical protein [Azoarcus sp.]